MSQRLTFKALAAAAVVGIGLLSSTAQAAIKDLSAFGWMAEMDPGVDLTVLSTTNNGITLSLEKFADFTHAPTTEQGFINPLKIVFTQAKIKDDVNPHAVPFINIVSETILNNTGATWTGFRWVVEGGLPNGGAVPHFDTAKSTNFNTDPFTVQAFSDHDKILTATSSSGGTLPSSVMPANIYSPGDRTNTGNGLFIAALPFTSGDTAQTFVLKEQPLTSVTPPPPVIPLPGAAWMSLVGLAGLGLISNAKNVKKLLS